MGGFGGAILTTPPSCLGAKSRQYIGVRNKETDAPATMSFVNQIMAGEQLLSAGNVSGARKVAEKVLAGSPQHDGALGLLHDCLRETHDYEAARKLAEQWLGHSPACLPAHKALIMSCLDSEDQKAARRALAVCQQAFPNETFYYRLIEGLLDLRFGNGKAASRIFAELGREHPGLADMLFIQGVTAYKRDRLFAARRVLQEAVALNPQMAAAWRILAFTAFHVMRFGQCRKAARIALSLDPTLKELRILIWLAWIVYFPPFFLTSIISFAYFCMSEHLGKLIAQIGAALAGYFIFGPLLGKGLRFINATLGTHISFYWIIAAIFGWLAVEFGAFWLVDRQKKNPKQDIQLKDNY